MKFPTGHYDNDQINVLQAAHKQACKELCIGKTDAVSSVASMMRLDGYESADVAGLLEDGVGKARERLEEALEAVRAFCEPVEPPRDERCVRAPASSPCEPHPATTPIASTIQPWRAIYFGCFALLRVRFRRHRRS